jgi:hypothetical protein
LSVLYLVVVVVRMPLKKLDVDLAYSDCTADWNLDCIIT